MGQHSADRRRRPAPQMAARLALCRLALFGRNCAYPDEGGPLTGVMTMRRRKLLLWLTLAAAAAMPAIWQTAPAGSAKAAQPAAAIPDFSGIWSHPYLTGFEPPASGPGPVRNKSRRPDGVANFQQLVGDYTNPILKPEAAQIVKQHGDLSLAGVGYQTPSNQCLPRGVAYVFLGFLVQLFQEKSQITMIYC